MRIFLFFVVFCLTLQVNAQKEIILKSKYFGNYQGWVSAYDMDAGNDMIHIDSALISINILKESIELQIGQKKQSGKYKILFEAEKYFVLDCIMENQMAHERVVVFKKGKVISRDGLYPQPSSYLRKKKK